LKENKFEKERDNLGREKLLKPKTKPKIYYNSPIRDIDPSKCFLFLDSMDVAAVEYKIDSLNPSAIQIETDFLIDSSYVLKIDSGAITNIYDQVNDSLQIEFTVANESAYGKMIVHIDTLDFNSDYILELLEGDKIIRTEIISTNDKKLVFELLAPKAYTLRLTKDDNRNGRWDPGSYIEKKFSEKMATKDIEAIREGWENEVTISMDVFDRKLMADPIGQLIDELK